MLSLVFLVPLHLPQTEAQDGHAHTQKESQKSDDNIPQRVSAAIHTGRRLKAGAAVGLKLRGHAGHGDRDASEQRKARRRSCCHNEPAAPEPFLPLFCGNSPFHLRAPFLIAPHL